MSTSILKFFFGRFARDVYAALKYPVWILNGRSAPDNHVYKKRRILKIARRHSCKTFIETGTFYGQMVKYAKNRFDVAVSIEIFETFQRKNAEIFAKYKNVHILLGDSSKNLPEAISLARGKIIYWLDGHYSGTGTGHGEKVSPIIEELRLIALSGRRDDCVIIDDRRLFTGQNGYPAVEETIAELKKINPSYNINFDLDCIVAEPK